MPRPFDRQESPIRHLAVLGNLDRLGSREIGPRQALRCRARSSIVPRRDHFAPLDAGAGAEVDKMIGRAHRVLVVLDDDHRIPLMREPLQGCQQPIVVTRVQADRRLVKHIENTRPGPAPTWLASRMRCASPPERVGAERSSAR